MNRPSTFLISLVLLTLLAITTLITLIAYSPTFNRPITRMLGMMDILGGDLPAREADIVLGQGDFTTSEADLTGGHGFHSPHGMAIDRSVSPNLLWVADTDNHRVLGFLLSATIGPESFPDFVLGQPDYQTRTPGAGRRGLNEPMALAVDTDGGLYIADLGNSRVVYYARPFEDAAEADWLFGQPDWNSSAPNPTGAGPTGVNQPRGVALDGVGNLYIADSGNHRILRIPDGAGGDGIPDRVWGQGGSFSTHEVVAGGDVSAMGLSMPWGIALGADQLLAVADTGNHRVLLFDAASESQDAIVVLGQHRDFSTATANREGVAANSLNSPTAVAFSGTGLFVADTDNHRVLHYSRIDSDIADGVWGQNGRYDRNESPLGAPTNESFAHPSGLAVDGEGNLYVADRDHHRVLVFRR